jgi:hypothetical protein
MYDPLTAVHYVSSSVPFVDWIFFNLIDYDQIPQPETKCILMTTTVVKMHVHGHGIDATCHRLSFLFLFGWLPIAWKEEAAVREKRKNKNKIK